MNFKSLPIPYGYAILFGIGLGGLFGLKRYLMLLYWGETNYFMWERDLIVHLVNYTTWALLIPLVYYFISKYKLGTGSTSSDLIKAIGASLLMSALHETSSSVLYFTVLDLLDIKPFDMKVVKHFFGAFPSAFISRMIEYWILYAVFTSIDSQRKLRDKQVELAKLESQLSGAQLNALRFQLQPHFLFNTLNTISSLVEIDKKMAQKMVSQLGVLLRTVLDEDKRRLIPLSEELAFVKGYLNIEQVRFNDRLEVKYRIEEGSLDAQVPSLILQPLVENAIKHGFARQPEQGTIEVITRKLHGDIQIIIRDDGQGTEQAVEQLIASGIGLKNVRDRLHLIYKTDYQFLIQSGKNLGFEVSIILPYQRS